MSEGTAMSERESESLPVHVQACAERYKTLFNRMSRIETILLGVAAGVGTLLLTVVGAVLIAALNKGLGL